MGACCGPARPDPGMPSPRPATSSPARADPTVVARLAHRAPSRFTLVGLRGGTFRMGSEDALAYPEDGEGPVRTVHVDPFALSPTTVTVAAFAAFVQETGHRTDAERHGSSFVFVGLLAPEHRESAPAVRAAPWWRQVAGATWWAPEGPGSSAEDRPDHPVTHVSQTDALAYARWVGARLPTEAEWELAARGGLDQQPYPWGAVREPGGRPLMNTFSGTFPDSPDAPVGTVAVDAYPANGYGLHQMTGNVWEWTSSAFGAGSSDPVLRGGSYLCHVSYCRRYRTSARTGATADSSLAHTGFRLAASSRLEPSAAGASSGPGAPSPVPSAVHPSPHSPVS